MLTKKEQELVDYWYNWKPGKKQFKSKVEDEPAKVEVKIDTPNLDYVVQDVLDGIWDII